ncbi:MAG: XRE family transcriptional regulator [Synergistales bacterium]|nr:XRE family transcriptional regulator [Synergistales bacterium]
MQSLTGVGARLLKERKRANLSRKGLADRTEGKVSERTIARIELEGHKNLQEETIVALEEALGVPLRLQSMADEVARLSGNPEHAIDIAINCRSIVKNLDNLKEPDLALVRASLEWVLDKIRGYETEKGTPVPDEDID